MFLTNRYDFGISENNPFFIEAKYDTTNSNGLFNFFNFVLTDGRTVESIIRTVNLTLRRKFCSEKSIVH